MSEGGDAAGKSRGTVSGKQTSRGKESHRVSERPSLTEYQSQRLRGPERWTKSLEAEKPRQSQQKQRLKETEEGWKVRERRKGRDTEIISDPERNDWMDTQRERGRDSCGTHSTDVGRETKKTGNCGSGPTQSSWQGWA